MALTITLNGEIHSFSTPSVMGIINVTPDSFFSGSRLLSKDLLIGRIETMIEEEVDIFDIGGYSTRPGADEVSPQEEYERLAPAIEIIRNLAPHIPISVDTFRADIASKCIKDFNVEIINDIGGGALDPEIFHVVAENKRAYILTHTRGTPKDMSGRCQYEDVVTEVMEDLSFKLAQLRILGVANVIIDPGFGFAKNIEQNFALLRSLNIFQTLGAPVLAGVSRKSMIWKSLDSSPEEALNGTTVLNTAALMAGANIIRVHDVKEARECVNLTSLLLKHPPFLI